MAANIIYKQKTIRNGFRFCPISSYLYYQVIGLFFNCTLISYVYIKVYTNFDHPPLFLICIYTSSYVTIGRNTVILVFLLLSFFLALYLSLFTKRTMKTWTYIQCIFHEGCVISISTSFMLYVSSFSFFSCWSLRSCFIVKRFDWVSLRI